MLTLNRILERIERVSTDKSSKPLRHAPVVIIGPPRSGSTLLYQCLLQRYEFGYISNLHHSLSGNPALAERLLWISRWRRRDSFESKHGNTEGWTGPSESWRYWYRFFPRHPQYVRIGDVDPQKMAELRGSMRALGNAFGKPVLIKNLPCTLRLGPLHEALPEAIYLVMRRDWCAMGKSILAGRKKTMGDYAKWWSVEPPGFGLLAERPPAEQVIEQIRGIYSVIDEARQEFGNSHFLDVSYEILCDDVHGTMERIGEFVARHAVPLVLRGDVPERFEPPQGGKLEPELQRQLEAYARQGQC